MVDVGQPARQALREAYQAMQQGEKSKARGLAQEAASMQPDWEQPWLVLAALANPHARLGYFKRALEINPGSRPARAGLLRAQQEGTGQSAERTRRVTNSQTSKSVDRQNGRSYAPTFRLRHPIPLLAALLVVLLATIYMLWPGNEAQALAAAHKDNALAPASQATFTATLPPTNGIPGIANAEPLTAPAAIATEPPVGILPSATDLPAATDLPPATNPATATSLPDGTPGMVAVQPADGLMDNEYAALQIPSGGEKRIVVTIHDQHLYAYQGNVLVFSFVVSTGGGNGTRTGSFTILDKLPKAYAPDWNFWMPDWMGIYYAGDLEDGFHSLPLLPDGQRLWGAALGTPITYGCVVLGIPESRLLYDWAEVGTLVQINP